MPQKRNNTPLTPEQWNLYVNNHNLFHAYRLKCEVKLQNVSQADIDVLEDRLEQAYYRAARSFNFRNGVRFSTFTYTCMYHAFQQWYVVYSKHKARANMVQLDEELEPEYKRKGTVVIPDMNDIQDILHHAKLTEREKTVIYKRYMERKNLRTIGKEIHASYQTVSNILKAAFSKTSNYVRENELELEDMTV